MSGDDSHDSHVEALLGVLLPMGILLLYITIGSWMEVKHFIIGHETGVIIMLCMVISIIVVKVKCPDLAHGDPEHNCSFLAWDNNLFFYFLLPLIIFTTGYNIRRRKFF